MRLSGKMKNTTTNNNEGWGLGLFLVFFPDNNNIGDNNSNPTTTSTNKKTLSSSSSFSSFTNHHHHQLFYKAQSTISICVILFVFTLLLFTLSNFDSTISQTTTSNSSPRRWLSDQQKVKYKLNDVNSSSSKALQGMGTLFRRGTRAMNDLVVAHLPEDMNRHNFLIFMRILHLSGITSKADVVILSSSLSTFNGVIHQENKSFLKMISSSNWSEAGGFNFTHFTKQSPGGETLWGRKVHSSSNHSNSNNDAGDSELQVNKLNYGSVVGFEVSELDPADTLSGFLEHIPIRLRRWACYPMLLGRLRRNFKHIMLIDANDVIPLGDPLSKIRHKGAESVHLWRNSEKTRSHDKKDSKSVNADVIVGGMRGVRLLSNAVLNEIVRVAMKKKSKTPVTDSVILSQIVNNDSLLKSSNVDASVGSSLPNANSVISMISASSSSSSSMWLSSLGMLHRDSSNQNVDVNHILHRQICTSVIDTFIYRDCYKRSIN